MERKKIGIIFGGKSGEHEISLLSAASVIRVINKEKYELVYIGITGNGEWKLLPDVWSHNSNEKKNITADIIENGTWINAAQDLNPGMLPELIDFALPIMHGPFCEDGKIQGLFEMLGIAYGGCGVLASALAMDKLAAKDVFAQNGLPVCRHDYVTLAEVRRDRKTAIEKLSQSVGFPCFVKPANMGSSVGISKAVNVAELETALDLALKYDRRVIVEEYINCREIETAILGNDMPEAAAVGEILPSAEFYDYKSKYFDDGASKLCVPADIPQETALEIRNLAVKAYSVIDGEGFARVDFFIDKDTGKIYLNEINTIPGFTKYSMFSLLWEEAGMKYQDVIERIIELGYERYYAENNGKATI